MDGMKRFLNLFVGLLLIVSVTAQEPYVLRLEEQTVTGLPGLHSFAAAQYDGNWILLGGRTDGLHMKQPFASFHPDYNNVHITVVNTRSRQVIRMPLDRLPVAVAEQLQSSNMEFVQADSLLFLFGGYGYSASQNRFLTHPRVTVVSLPALLRSATTQTSLAEAIQSIEDNRVAVTGGGVGLLNGRFYLAGGQKFTGRYNPHGPDHGSGFVQEYTNAIRSFELQQQNGQWVIVNFREWVDKNELHRRDYNLVPQYFTNGKPGFTMFSGVFRYDADLPWLHPVDFDEQGYQPRPAFQQKFSHYHAAHIPLYSKRQHQMHAVFFGGIAQYFIQDSAVQEDKEVPFVTTISQVTRLSDGTWNEQVLPVQMPGLLGTSAWMAVNEQLPMLQGGIVDWDLLPEGEQLLGYIIGGIRSTAPNIFWPNTGKQSTASSSVFAVYVRKKQN